MLQFPRASGILLHITSLPSEYGIGDMGDQAYRFVDFLADSGQHIWQILPLGPTIQCNSPYSCYSAFAGNPLLISPRMMQEDGFLTEAELDDAGVIASSDRADFDAAGALKWNLLRQAHARHRSDETPCQAIDQFESFCTAQRWWLDDFAFFTALMKHLDSDQWSTWESGLVRRDSQTLGEWRGRLSKEIELEQFVQYLFFEQWRRLKEYANSRHVRMFGDMPIFVSYGSADVWANQDVFQLNEQGRPTVVAGVPPDYFSKTGQLWGNPLYCWDRLRETNYAWWTQRFQSAFQLYDLLRIDHFRGFESYWEVPASAKTAIHGRWAPGPGSGPFDAARRKLGELAIVAEDLGMITEEVHHLRDQLEFPGMRILQFGFDNANDGFHRPENFPENSVAYTGTHDNNTIVSWYQNRQAAKTELGKRDILDAYLAADTDERTVHWQLISMVFHSASHTAIVPMQDVLGLDDEARMNMPGEAHGNWGWRIQSAQLTHQLAEQLRVITENSERLQVSRV